MPSGTIVKKDDKGFGFIKPAGSGKDMFFHVTGLRNRAEFEQLSIGDSVTYEVDQAGERPRAVDVARS